jgi:ribosomal protein L22
MLISRTPHRLVSMWQKVKNLLPRSIRTPGDSDEAVKISPSPHHSIAAMSKEAIRQEYLARCAAFTSFSIRTPFVRYSPQKLNELARLLPGLTLPNALCQMKVQDRKGARLAIIPLLNNAVNVVRQRQKQPQDFTIQQAMVGRGRYRKRLDIKGRGRVGIIRRPSCFLRIVVALPDKSAKLRSELRKHVNRALRKQVREDKPLYLPLRY